MKRQITLTDGTDMGGELLIFETNAPAELLKRLEEESCKAVMNDEDVPIWKNVVEENGFIFEFIDSHTHVTPYGTSTDWLEEHKVYSKIKEHYVIENQPTL